MKSLVFLDIDGTILPEGKTKIAPDVLAAINAIKENGNVPFICTGRNVGAAKDIIEQTGLNSYVTSNGQEVTIDGKSVYSACFNDNEVKSLIKTINMFTPKIAVENFEGLNIEDTEEGRALVKMIVGHGFVDSKAISPLPMNGIYQVWAFGEKEQLNDLQFELKGKAQLYRWNDNAIEIAPHGSGKGNGIEVAKMKFKEQVKTYGVGDGINDYSMMEVVDVSIAMGNASLELKQKCDYITTDCDDAGVENAMRHFGVIK